MLHTIIYHGRFTPNFERLRRDKQDFLILGVDGKERFPVEPPSAKVDGIVFGYMEKSKLASDPKRGIFAVKVADIVLEHPIELKPRRHSDGKGYGPKDPLFGDQSAKRLLRDMIAKNPEQETELMAIYHKYFGGALPAPDPGARLPEEVTAADTLYEGAVRQVSVNAYERNREARHKCIAHYGVSCCVCGFNFETAYGKAGKGLVHVHHLRQLANVGKKYKVDPIRDLRPVCPNCHAMIHSHDPMYTIEQVKTLLRRQVAWAMNCSALCE